MNRFQIFGSSASFITSVFLLCGCTTPVATMNPIQAGENALVPVNLFLNTGQVLDRRTAEELMYLQQHIADSGLFEKVHFGVSPWPYSVRMEAVIDCTPSAGEAAGAIAAAATLFLVPHPETCSYKIKADFFDGANLLTSTATSEAKSILIYNIFVGDI